MTNTRFIDFETYYDDEYSLRSKGQTYLEFIKDRRFKVFGMAVTDGQTEDWIDARDVRKWFASNKKSVIAVHNGFFDYGVLKWHYDIVPAYMIDTLLIANHVLGSSRDLGGQKNDLASVAQRLGLEAKGEYGLKGIRNPTEGQMIDAIKYAKGDVRIGWQILQKLLPQFSNADFEFWLMDHTFRIYLEKPLEINTDKLAETKVLVEKRAAEILAKANVSPKVLKSDKQFRELLGCTLEKHSLKLPMKRAKNRKDGSTPLIPATSKGDGEFLKLAESPVPEISNLVQARLVVRSSATVAARLATMEKFAKLGFGIPVHLVYYGAHTGRFSGGGGFNFLNLTSPDRATSEIERLIANMIREIVSAGDGKVFAAVDAAQIEARIVAWLAGQQDILDAFAAGADIYSDFIGDVIEEDIHKPTGKESPEEAARLILMRGVGKEGILGLGFSMGWEKFLFTLKNKPATRKMVESGVINEEFARKVVAAYREKYTKIVKLWKDLEKAFHVARIGGVRRVGFLTFRRVGPNAVGITLPSGRVLYYRNIRSEPYKGKPLFKRNDGEWGTVNTNYEWKHGAGQKVYGGLLAENATQAVARDILAGSILAAEEKGYSVNLHVYDEIVARVEESKGQEAKEFLIKSLSTAPDWGPGLVLNAEGKVAKTLVK